MVQYDILYTSFKFLPAATFITSPLILLFQWALRGITEC